jgi:hypothetical protein
MTYTPLDAKGSDFEQITVSSTAVGFTATKLDPVSPIQRPSQARVFVNTNAIRVVGGGLIPTVSSGAVISAGQSFLVTEDDLRTFKMIRDGGSDAEVAVMYSSNQKS